MSKLSKLLQVTDEERTAILKHYEMTEEQFEENVNKLTDWISKCEHLPQDNDKNKFRVALLNSKMSLERAKEALEGYYQIRTRYSNEFFDKMIPSSNEYKESKKFAKSVAIPKLTPDLCRVTIFKMSDPNGEARDAYLYEILTLMMAEMRILNDLFLSNIIVIDLQDISWKNFLKFTPVVNQKLLDILMTVNLRIHSVHFLNVPNFIEHIMRVVKSLLPAKLFNKIHTHKSYESLLDHIPRESLPSNYGGTEKSIDELHDEWCEQIEESEEVFQKLLSAKSTKKTELDAAQQDMFGCGAVGSFRTLALD